MQMDFAKYWLLAICASVIGAKLSDAEAAGVRSPQQLAATIVRLPYLSRELTDGFRVTDSEVVVLPREAVTKGLKASAAFELKGASGLYNVAILYYNLFDDQRSAQAYEKSTHYDAYGVSATIDWDIKMSSLPGALMSASVTARCGVVDDTDYSLNCSIYEPRIPAVITLLLTPGPSPSEQGQGELPMNTAFRKGGEVRAEALIHTALHQLARATIGN